MGQEEVPVLIVIVGLDFVFGSLCAAGIHRRGFRLLLRNHGRNAQLAELQVCFHTEKARIAGNNDEFLNVLEYLAEELERRKAAFAAHGCRNIAEYNKAENWMPRIVLMVDEASFVFDTTGVSDKTVKEQVSKILGLLINLTRVGRYAGIHVIVATQRPDTLSVPGALKANLDTRICARMSDVATSTVILDDGSATNLPAIKGRFLLRDGSGTDIALQVYLFLE